MSNNFIRELSKICVAVTVVSAVICIILGAVLCFFQAFVKFFLYAVGVTAVIVGIVMLVSIIRALILANRQDRSAKG